MPSIFLLQAIGLALNKLVMFAQQMYSTCGLIFNLYVLKQNSIIKVANATERKEQLS